MNFKITLTLAALVLTTAGLQAEEVTITTFYPAPGGVYNEVETTGKTLLATDGESFVGIGTDTPVSELDIRHSDPEAATGGDLVVHLSASDQEQVQMNFFTKGQPSQKSLTGDTNVKAWQITAKGSDRQTENTAPNDERGNLKFSFYDGDTEEFSHTMSLAPGKVGINRLAPEYELDINGSLGIGDSQTQAVAEIFADTPPASHAARTTFRSAAVPASGTAFHAFHFRTNDQSAGGTTRKTIPDVVIDGTLTVGTDIQLNSTSHSMKQTGFVTGTYTGSGSNQTINIGFQPRYIKIWSQALGTGFINASVFEKTLDMTSANGVSDSSAVFSFSTGVHQSVAGGSPTRNEDTMGFTYTYLIANLIQIQATGFTVFGTSDIASGYFQTSGLYNDGSNDVGIPYFFIAYR